MNEEYTLTIIEDMETPLAAAPAQSAELLGYAVAGVIVVAILLMITFYVLECNKYRKRLTELRQKYPEHTAYSIGWNLSRLKEQLVEEENEIAGLLFDKV